MFYILAALGTLLLIEGITKYLSLGNKIGNALLISGWGVLLMAIRIYFSG